MIKRGVISFAGGLRKFRMSIRDVDVETATPGQLLLDEAILYPQVVQSFFVPWSSSETTIPLIDIGQVPFVKGYVQMASGEIAYPSFRYYAGDYYQAMSTRFWMQVSPTQLKVNFHPYNTLAGVRFITYRRATG